MTKIKVIIDYDNSDTFESQEVQMLLAGAKMYGAIQDVLEKIRTNLKHGDHHEEYQKACEDIRKHLREELTERGVHIEDWQ